ncbi:IS200/IS605 family transposase [Orrella sp. 11846]|uniref:IS200/IS605 family transposase n=1 Tax=Orrella sp. 11846 TaxID=3409913 RepID=UPI003B5947EC
MHNWRTGRSCLYKNYAHLVFTTKYRQMVFTKEMLEYLQGVFMETCEQMGCELLEFSGEDSHVHLLVSIHPKVAVANLVSKLKGKSSYLIRKEFKDHVKTMLWGKQFWSPSYCVVSCDGTSLDVVNRYISEQNAPPSEKSLRAAKAANKSKTNELA